MAAAFWMKPHIIALDEPTNYIDMETVESLIVALQRFKGGVICISHSKEFAERVCNETWMLEGGGISITKKEKEKVKKVEKK
jgi:ATPase subunit of ABC transporter with duplicated ATPase domains